MTMSTSMAMSSPEKEKLERGCVEVVSKLHYKLIEKAEMLTTRKVTVLPWLA